MQTGIPPFILICVGVKLSNTVDRDILARNSEISLISVQPKSIFYRANILQFSGVGGGFYNFTLRRIFQEEIEYRPPPTRQFARLNPTGEIFDSNLAKIVQ